MPEIIIIDKDYTHYHSNTSSVGAKTIYVALFICTMAQPLPKKMSYLNHFDLDG